MHIKIQKDVRNKFKSLQAEQPPGAMIEYLSSILQTENADTFFTGFCYWNISDSFASNCFDENSIVHCFPVDNCINESLLKLTNDIKEYLL